MNSMTAKIAIDIINRRAATILKLFGEYSPEYKEMLDLISDFDFRFNKDGAIQLSNNKINRKLYRKINEQYILEWAKDVAQFNDYYKYNDRCGCMFCPLSSRKNFAYLAKYYPDKFNQMLVLMKNTEIIREKELGRPFSVISSNPKYNADYLEDNIKNKWLPRLEQLI